MKMDIYLTNMFGLKGKTILLIGGTRGIGRGLAIAL
jgi:NAD(P)-dependent dehydrogenase (short-subunit alcohol dehydrogenase family)